MDILFCVVSVNRNEIMFISEFFKSFNGHALIFYKTFFDFAPKPDLVFYLDVPIDVLTSRINSESDFDYYESGRDIGLSTDFYESFKLYQNKILDEYGKMIDEYGFIKVDGTDTVDNIHEVIKKKIIKLVDLKLK